MPASISDSISCADGDKIGTLQAEGTSIGKESDERSHKDNGHQKDVVPSAGKEIEEEKRQVPSGQPAYKRTKAEIDADARTEWDRHYKYLRDAAQAKADANRERAESDGEYTRVHREIRGLEPAIERSRHDGAMETAEQLARRRKALKVQEARILARLGLTAADLEPKWSCQICHDTGFRIKDGKMCDCWRPPRRSS